MNEPTYRAGFGQQAQVHLRAQVCRRRENIAPTLHDTAGRGGRLRTVVNRSGSESVGTGGATEMCLRGRKAMEKENEVQVPKPNHHCHRESPPFPLLQ